MRIRSFAPAHEVLEVPTRTVAAAAPFTKSLRVILAICCVLSVVYAQAR